MATKKTTTTDTKKDATDKKKEAPKKEAKPKTGGENESRSLEELEKARSKATGEERAALNKSIAEKRKQGTGTTTTEGKETTQEEVDKAYKDSTERAKNTTEDIMGTAMGKGEEFANKYIPTGTFGTVAEGTSPEMRAYIDRLNANAAIAGQYTGLENESISGMRDSLGGYSSPQMQAQREYAKQGINQDLRTQLRLQELSAARNRVRGAAAMAGQQSLQQGAQQAGANVERDIFLKNADETQRRREAFNNLVRGTEDARFGRQTTAEGQYGAAMGGEENVQRGLQEFNIGQKQNEALARSGVALSGAGVYTGLYGGEQGNQLAQKYMDDANKINTLYYENMLKRQKTNTQTAA